MFGVRLSLLTITPESIGAEHQFGVDPKSIYQGALESVNEFVADGVLDNHADVTGNDITLPSPPGSTSNPGIRQLTLLDLFRFMFMTLYLL